MIDATRTPSTSDGLADRPMPCLLCDRPATVHSIYFPGPNTRAAAPPGKSRIIMYALCEHCAECFGVFSETIEAKIESELRRTGITRA